MACLALPALAAVVTIVFSFVVTFIILKVLDLIIGIRVNDEDEERRKSESDIARR